MADGVSTFQMNEMSGKPSGKAGKYLTFRLSEEMYGLEILKVQEIIGMTTVTHVPQTPQFVRGVINLRGKVISVMDLRLRLGLGAKENTNKTCIIVVRVNHGNHAHWLNMGIIVDEVSEVLGIEDGQIESPPEFGASVAVYAEFIQGMSQLGEKVVMLLDIDKVFSREEITLAEGVAQ